MSNGLSAILKPMRKSRGLTLAELAFRAGVTHPTLSRWERGVCHPRLPELEAVLNALDASPAQRRQALTQMERPRAAQRLDAEARKTAAEFTNQAGTLPHGGDLLRAMRHRRGWRLEDLAAQTGISISTLSRWEQGDTWPSAERLKRLCAALGASPPEIEALRCGRFSLADSRSGAPSLEALEHEFRAHLEPLLMLSELNPGLELRFLRLEAALWPHALQRDSARPLLADVYAHHANYLRNFRRNGVKYARRAQDLMPRARSVSYSLGLAVVCEADQLVHRTPDLDPQAGVRWLRSWLRQEMPPEMRAWMLRKIAGYMGLGGQPDAALATIKQIGDFPWKNRTLSDARENQRYTAEILLLAKRPGEAFRHVPEEPDSYAPNQIRDVFVKARATLQCGERTDCHRHIVTMYALITAHGLEHWRKSADALAEQLSARSRYANRALQ